MSGSESITALMRDKLTAANLRVESLESQVDTLQQQKISAEATRFAALSIIQDVISGAEYQIKTGVYEVSPTQISRMRALLEQHSE